MHSSASFDCSVRPDDVVDRCRRVGLGPVFLTDHNTIDGARQLQAATQSRVVVGEEIMTTDGELIGLFLEELVPGGLSAAETAAEIRRQGGLVYLGHPYDAFRRPVPERVIELIADDIDIVEVFNGRSDNALNRRSMDLCETLGAAPGAGSDAHDRSAIGAVQIRMEDFTGAQDFLAKLRQGEILFRQRGIWPIKRLGFRRQ